MADSVSYVQDAMVWTVDPGATVSAGDVAAYATPNFIGVWANDGVDGTENALRVKGVFKFAKEASLAIAVGDLCYWDDTAKEIDKTNTNVNAGICTKAALAADTEVEVLIDPAFANHS